MICYCQSQQAEGALQGAVIYSAAGAGRGVARVWGERGRLGMEALGPMQMPQGGLASHLRIVTL